MLAGMKTRAIFGILIISVLSSLLGVGLAWVFLGFTVPEFVLYWLGIFVAMSLLLGSYYGLASITR